MVPSQCPIYSASDPKARTEIVELSVSARRPRKEAVVAILVATFLGGMTIEFTLPEMCSVLSEFESGVPNTPLFVPKFTHRRVTEVLDNHTCNHAITLLT